jgi:hypothetical protein
MDGDFALPPLTKSAVLLSATFTVLTYLDICDWHRFYFDPKRILRDHEYWRCLSGPFFLTSQLWPFLAAYAAFPLIIRNIENRLYFKRKSTLFFIFLLVVTLAEICGFALHFVSVGAVTWLAFEYLAGRLFPADTIAPGLGIKLKWFTFLHAFLLSMSVGMKPVICGLVIGHVMFYVLYLLPLRLSRQILRTPTVLKWIFREQLHPEEVRPAPVE